MFTTTGAVTSGASNTIGTTGCTVQPHLQIDHYKIIHDGEGLTCDAEMLTINACTNVDDGSCTLSDQIVTLDVKTTGSTSVIDSISFTGTGTASLPYLIAESTILSLENASVAAANPAVCSDGITSTCNLVFVDAGFRFLNGSSGSSGIITSQIAGTSFPLRLQAVKNNDGVCEGLFNGDKNIDLSQENVNPGGASGLSFSIDGNSIEKHTSLISTILNFGADSIATIPTPIYHDAGEIRLHANYDVGGVAVSGSSNTFWVSPAELVVSATLGATALNGAIAIAATTHKAGENFAFGLSAFNSLGVITPNYSPGQIQLLLIRMGPTLPLSVDGILSYGAAGALATSTSPVFQNVTLTNFSSGVSTYNAAQYSEVGLLNVDLQDSNYGSASIVIPAAAIDIGRFIPEHFKQTVADDGFFLASCNATTTFVAYSGQMDEATNSIGAISYLSNPVLAITAYNKQGLITQNCYEDSQGSGDDYMKMSASDVSVTVPTLDQVALGIDTNKLALSASMNTGTLSQNDLTSSSGGSALPKGVLHYQLSDADNFFYHRSANALLATFTSDIDFSTATIKDADDVDVTTTVDASPIGVEIRFVRLRLKNSFGPETSNISQAMLIEQFDGTTFVATPDDNCTSYDADKISLTNISVDPALTNVFGGTGSFQAGKTQAI
ncbi:MAG: MSHA biogenesis protein MshQ [Candidatus Azotimanducaceae bacterium]|jgi:MSHA biogenesis protein MshQ